MCEELNVFLEAATNKANATIFDVQINDPLNMVVVHFDSSPKDVEVQNADAFQDSLRAMDSYMIQENAKSIYVRKDIKYYNDNAQAIEDATSLIADILNMR